MVRDLEVAYGFWRDRLGLPVIRAAEVPDQGVRAALLACGPSEIELLEPTAPDGGVARFLARRGEGPHHLCFETDGVGSELQRLAGGGAELIDRVPRRGLAGMVAFLHPRACAGVLVELATPVEHAPLPWSPLAVHTVHLAVHDVAAAVDRYTRLFRLHAVTPTRVTAGGVALQFDPVPDPSVSPGLAGLRLVAATGDGEAIVLGPEGTHGVSLVIGEPPTREDLA